MTMTKRGKMNGFRTMLGAMAIAAMTMVGCGANTGVDDGAADSGKTSVNEEIEIGMESTLNLEEPYEIGINGRAICLPSTVDEFLNQYPEFTVEYELEDVRTEYMGGTIIHMN